MESKKELREIYLNKRDALSNDEIEQKSVIIQKKIIENEFFNEASVIFSYISMGSEVITRPIIEHALSRGKTVAVPVTRRGEMSFIQIKSLEGLRRSKFGVMEPLYNDSDIIQSGKGTINIVPGIVFDRQRHRIGYGAGYYDRHLKNGLFLKNIGICFAEQLIDSFNKESHDINVDIVITDREDIYE